MKKIINFAALFSLMFVGVSASVANADTAFVNSANLASATANFSVTSTNTSSLVLPAGVSTVTTHEGWSFTSAFLLNHAGQNLSYSVAVTDPSGNVIQKNMSLVGTSQIGYTESYGGNLSKAGAWVSTDFMTGNLAIPADPTGYSGSYNPTVTIVAGNVTNGGTLPAGTYTLTFTLKANGTAVGAETGLTTDVLHSDLNVSGTSTVVPTGATSSSYSAQLCVDSSKIAANDQVKAEMYLDGVLESQPSISWKTRSTFKSQSDPGYRTSSSTQTVTVTQYDVTNGLGLSTNLYRGNPTAGTTHEISFKLYNTTTNADVSGDCAPAKPAAPTASFMFQQLSVSGNFSFGSEAAQCALYDKVAPTVVVSSSYGYAGMPGSSQYSCNMMGLVAGHTYFIKVRGTYYDKFSDYSDPSADIVVPVGGYTITSQYAGVVGAGKIVKVNDNSIPIEELSNYAQSLPDGKGGLYTVGYTFSCSGTCGTTKFRIRHMSNTTLDSTFAGTGSVVLDTFTPANPNAYTMGYYGTAKDKWVVPVSGYDSNLLDPKVQFIFGNSANATTTYKEVGKDAINQACAAGATGYSLRPNYTAQLSMISAPTANPFVLLTCWKQYTMGDNTQQWVSLGVLASIDPTTGTLSVKGALGTPSASANGFNVRTSVNPDATGDQPMITAFVSSYLYTSLNQNNVLIGTVADHSIIRIKADGTFISTTTGAWGTTGGNSSTDATPSFPAINSGTIYGILRAGLGSNLVKVTSTGAAATPLAIDTTGSPIANAALTPVNGYPIASNETLIPVAVSGMTDFAAGWVNASTGVLTVGEKLSFTYSQGAGSAAFWLAGNDKNTYLLLSASTAPNNLTVFKWIDSRYVVPTGPVPTVTSKDVKYSKNTPAAAAKVTLTGTHLDVVTSATIGGVAATLGTKTATSLQLTIPTAAAAGTVDIVLTTTDGPTTVSTFTYVGTGVQQNVTIQPLASPLVMGATDLALSASVDFSPNDAGTAGAITWSSDTPTVCSIVSGKAHFLTAGTCTVKATAAASGLLLSGSTTRSTNILAASQTITLTGPTNPEVDLDGVDLVASASSGLPLTFATSTAGVCSVDAAGHVTAITAGDCIVTATQAGNGGYSSATQSVTVTFVATSTAPIVDNGNPDVPTAVSTTGAYVANGDTATSWTKAKGALNFKLSVVYIGPIKATGVFKVGAKTYTCVVSFGTLKKQATNKRLTITSPNLCSGATEKVQLAALKKVPANTAMKITFVRELHVPTTYAKLRNRTRVLYLKLG